MRVLVIEDEPAQAEALRLALEADGYDVDVANDGPDGLWHADHGAYSAIVLDLLLPGLNGYLVCRRLREAGDLTPILMLTAKDGVYDEAEGLDTGADDYLTKPFSFVVLLARLRALVRRSAQTGQEIITIGDLDLDPYERLCYRRGTAIALTQREVSVLIELARQPGVAVSKASLINAIWGLDFDEDPNIVEVYIRRLRAKIDEPFDVSSIRTVRGAGYKLVPTPAEHTAAQR